MAVSLAALLAGCTSHLGPVFPKKLMLAVQSAKVEETRTAWQPLVDDLAKQFGIPINPKTLGQAETFAALTNGTADIVWLGSSMAVGAVADPNAKTFALYFNVKGTND